MLATSYGQTPASAPAVPTGGQHPQKTLFSYLGKGPDVSGRQTAALHSHAVERGNRRYRKMQKSVYRVRTQEQIRARLALDMWREAHAEGRQQTLAALHRARAG